MKSWIYTLQKLLDDNNWTITPANPTRTQARVIVQCHKHIADAEAQDPSVSRDGCYTWKTRVTSLLHDLRGCRHCAGKVVGTIERAAWFATKNGFILKPGQEVKGNLTRLSVECQACEKHSIKTYTNLMQGFSCNKCTRAAMGVSYRKEEEIKEIIEAAGGSLEGVSYLLSPRINKREAWVTFTCAGGKQHSQLRRSIQQGVGCACKTESSHEYNIRTRLEYATCVPWVKIHSRRLKKLTGCEAVPTEIDLFSDDLRIGIEVDGFHHRMPSPLVTADQREARFLRQLDIDRNKDEFFEQYKFELARHIGPKALIRINTDDIAHLSIDQLNDYVICLMTTHGIPNIGLESYVQGWPLFQREARLREIKYLAQSLGLNMPEQEYLGCSMDYRFICPNHGEVTRRVGSLNAGRGCPKCIKEGRAAKTAAKFLTFEALRTQVREDGIRSCEFYREVYKQRQGWPSHPHSTYAAQWPGWKEFLRNT